MGGKLRSVVTAKWLAENLKSSTSKIHVTQSVYEPQNNTTGSFASSEYLKSHIPNASYVNLYELANKNAEIPLTVPIAKQFSEYASKRGIKKDDHIVIYDQDPNLAFHYSTCRTWLLFKIFGHEGEVSILHGGLKSWIDIGGEVTDEVAEVEKSDYKATFDDKMVIMYDSIVQNSKSNNSEFQLIDARGKSGFDEGNVPGATNVPFSEFYGQRGSLKDVDQIRDVFEKRGVDLTKPTVSMCRGGISACMLSFAAHQLGAKVPIYDGSWTEILHKGGLK